MASVAPTTILFPRQVLTATMLTLCLLAFCLTVSVQGQVDPHQHGHAYELLFNAVDHNGDDIITRAEFNAFAPTLDLNEDGEVTEEEFVAAFESVTADAQDPEGNHHAAVVLFEAIDSTSNSTIPVDQMDPLFHLFDSDSDGEVTDHEFLHEWDVIHPNHGTHQHHP